MFCPHYPGGIIKRRFYSENASNVLSTPPRRNLKTHQSPAILDLTRKSRDYRDVIAFAEKLCFQNVFRPHENEKPAFSNSSGLKNVFEKLRFRDGLVWTVDLTFSLDVT